MEAAHAVSAGSVNSENVTVSNRQINCVVVYVANLGVRIVCLNNLSQRIFNLPGGLCGQTVGAKNQVNLVGSARAFLDNLCYGVVFRMEP